METEQSTFSTTVLSKAEDTAAPSSPLQNEPQSTPSPDTVLVALTTSLVCWLLTGIVDYTSPSTPIDDDMILLAIFLWIPQLYSVVYLIYVAGKLGSSIPAGTLSVAMAGVSTALSYGLRWAQWGNVATCVLWMDAGICLTLGLETKFEVVRAVERRMGTMLDS